MIKAKYIHLALATTSSILVLSSCAGPESYQQKMARYEPKSFSQNLVPDIKTGNFKFKNSPKSSESGPGRFPASVKEGPPQTLEGKEINPTNKKLYFLTLFSQYETLKHFSAEFSAPSVSICPNFHNGLLGFKDKYSRFEKNYSGIKKLTYDSAKFDDEMYLASKPELLLPLSKDTIAPKVIDIIKSSPEKMSGMAINELVNKAIEIHLAKTYSEIRELCEYGVSDNYFVYENLITHIKNNKFEAGPQNMNTLLKTTVFSNIALINSLDKENTPARGRSIASVGSEEKVFPYSNEVITRMSVPWVNQYFNYIKESH